MQKRTMTKINDFVCVKTPKQFLDLKNLHAKKLKNLALQGVLDLRFYILI